MTIQLFVSPISMPNPLRLSAGTVLRVVVTLAAFTMAVAPALSASPSGAGVGTTPTTDQADRPAHPTLRGDVTAAGDVLSVADLVDGVTGAAATRALFRAPALGETGTIQVQRIAGALAALGIGRVETGGRVAITVTRAARRAGAPEIEAAVKRALEVQGVDARPLSVRFEGAPALVVAPDVQAPVTVEELVHDPRTNRVSALVAISPRPGERRAALRVTGALVELVDVAVLNRPLARGETVQAGDVTLERRTREGTPQDVQSDAADLVGRVARRALGAGSTLRTGDLARPEIVARGDVVTVVYEVPGLVLTLRGRASQGGALGDSIAVQNPVSKKTLQAQVVAPGKVSVSGPTPGPMAAVDQPARP